MRRGASWQQRNEATFYSSPPSSAAQVRLSRTGDQQVFLPKVMFFQGSNSPCTRRSTLPRVRARSPDQLVDGPSTSPASSSSGTIEHISHSWSTLRFRTAQ